MAEEKTVVDGEKKQESNGGEPDYEALASEIGWAPKDKFRGDPSKHIDAKTYYEKGEFVLPIVKQQREDARKEAKRLADELAEVRSTIGEFQKFTQAAADRQVAELKTEIAALKDVRAKAVADGDDKAFRAAEDAIDEKKDALDKAKEKPKAVEAGDPEFETWVKENDWYKTDAKKRRVANAIGLDLTQENPNLRGAALFKAVTEEMERIDAERGGTERPGPMRGGKPSGTNSKAQTYDNLKPEFKQGFEKWKRSGLSITKDQYVAQCGPEAWSA